MNENSINIIKKEKVTPPTIPTEESFYKSEIEKRGNFLSSQKGSNIEGTKRFDIYEKFKEDPSKHLIDLYTKDLEKERDFLKDLEKEGEFIDNTPDSDTAMHLRNIKMLERKIALFKKFGKEAEADMLANGTEESLKEENIENTFKSFASKQILDDKFRFLSLNFTARIKPIKYYALAVMFSTLPVLSQSSQNSNTKEKHSLEDTRTMKTTNEKLSDSKTTHWNMHIDDTMVNKEEEEVLNPNFILTPVSLEYSVDESTMKKATMEVPLTYAQDFKTTDFTNKDDALQIQQHLQDELRKDFANKLQRILQTKGAYKANREGGNDLLKNEYSKNKITSIKITGYSSPEGSTPESVIPGNEEKENKELAKGRGEMGQDVIKNVLEENEIDLSVLDSVRSEEVQFSDVEMESLTNLADSLGISGREQEDKIYNLISKYNDGQYNDNEQVKKVMDEVVGSKRGVTIEIEYESTEKKQVTVAIPNFLLLLALFLKKKRKDQDPSNSENNDNENEVEDVKVKEVDNSKNEKVIIPENILKKGTVFGDGLYEYKIISNNPLWRLAGKIRVASRYMLNGEEKVLFLNKKDVKEYIKKGTMRVVGDKE